jgi:MraZ protein
VDQLAREVGESGPEALRGSAPARIDDKGRLKVPTLFRENVQQTGSRLFVTSVSGDCVRLYPLRVWTEVEKRLKDAPRSHPTLMKFQDRVSYYGASVELDGQGRVLIPARLRQRAAIEGEVRVVGRVDHLEVWNEERLAQKIESEGWTAADQLALAEFGL